MSNYNWVCFDCHFAKRQAKTSINVPKCPHCQADLYCLGYKVEVPKKTDKKSWKCIKESSFHRDLDRQETLEACKTRRKHELEKEIERVGNLPNNKENNRTLKRLKESLRTDH